MVIVGPTASGKTSLGIELAKEIGGELVSFDSRQVYREMDIGTGKDVGNSRFVVWRRLGSICLGYYLIQGVPIWLLDVVSPRRWFTAADFARCAWPVIQNLWAKNHVPILVGGTGFYLQASLGKVDTLGVRPKRLWRQWASLWPLVKLQARLAKIDPDRWERMNASDRANPRRLVRALEISRSKKSKKTAGLEFDRVVKIGLDWPIEKVDERIEQRIIQRLEQGLENEVRKLSDRYGWDSALGRTIAYQEWRDYLAGKSSQAEAISRWGLHERQYARRQLTWFKKGKGINWVAADKLGLAKLTSEASRLWRT